MTHRLHVHRGRYVDSVRLMRMSESLQALPGVDLASIVMGTARNLDLLVEQGFSANELRQAGPDDLLVAIQANGEESADLALMELETLLASASSRATRTDNAPLARSLESECKRAGAADIAVVAVPGIHAALEAWAALRQGSHVFIFSDNVAIDDEVRLKAAGVEAGLLVMGPDCGTAIIDGVGLGFANRVRQGRVGLVGASGTGLQQVMSLLHAAGEGIAAAIGTGSRDLWPEVGGMMTHMGIDRLVADPAVECIGLISKPGDEAVAQGTLDHLSRCGKPAVACMPGNASGGTSVVIAETLTEAAELLVRAIDPAAGAQREALKQPAASSSCSPAVIRRPGDVPRRLAGVFCGGTLCREAALIVKRLGCDPSGFVDVGADAFTQGRAHPMIDPRLRSNMIARAGEDAQVLLFDVVLGDLAHPSPGHVAAEAVEEAVKRAARRAIRLRSFASLIGTDLDPQGYAEQEEALEAVGVRVSPRNSEAAVWAAEEALS